MSSAFRQSLSQNHSSFYLAASNVRTLKQAGQQAALALTPESLGLDMCCVSETRIQDASTAIELTALSVSTRFRLRTSGDPVAAAVGCAGVGMVLSHRAEQSLLDWIPVDSRLCAVRLTMSVKESQKRQVDVCQFIVSAYAPTDCSSDAVKDRFYKTLNALLRQAKSSDIVVVAGDMNAQVGKLSAPEIQLEGRHGLDSLCVDRRLFLCSTSFRNSRSRLATWCPSTTGQAQTQIDHSAINYRWRGSITDCRSFGEIFVDSDDALVRSGLSLRFLGPRKVRTNRMATERLTDPDVRQTYKDRLLDNIPTGPENNPVRRAIRRQVKLICAAGPGQPPVSQIIKNRNGTTTSNKEERLDRTLDGGSGTTYGSEATAYWTVEVEPPTARRFSTAYVLSRATELPVRMTFHPHFSKTAVKSSVSTSSITLLAFGKRSPELEQRQTYKRPTILIFPDFRGALDSVDRSVLLETLARQGMPQKFVNIIRSLYSQTFGRVSVYGELSKSFRPQSGVRQTCPLSTFLFNFVIGEILRRTPEGLRNPGVRIASEENLVDLEYADDILLMFEEEKKAQVFLDELTKVIPSFDIHFAPTKLL
ncbi:hypothetical protein T265_11075 [Opisthorchis viverrini]|uniref:Reverse transcriptase domain-containing protein n=1 Tax=Opisthorchis viverrini TaxID=6198 RepID=A0A074Z4B1_OPIVI|nr:hypothetical protein T265_11075 [Opisthorchis viverrini]KER20357.1 hypothetical protein T265_11075 [Opisthorchis viverrini]